MAMFSDEAGGEVEQCGICLEPFVDAYTLSCFHTFCRGCISEYKKRGVNDVCPYCRAPLPPGVQESLDECFRMAARIMRFKTDGKTAEVEIMVRLLLVHAQNAVTADPRNAQARGFFADALYDSNDRVGAGREYGEVVKLDPNNSLAHHNLGALLSDLKDHDRAELEYRAAVRCAPEMAEAHCSLGKLLLTVREDFDGAQLSLREALRLDPTLARAHYNMGALLYIGLEDFAGAALAFRESIKYNPSHAESHVYLGMSLGDLADHVGSERSFEEAVRLDPTNQMYSHMLKGARSKIAKEAKRAAQRSHTSNTR
jgi:tetratricopeptide (TPR) repeat protein